MDHFEDIHHPRDREGGVHAIIPANHKLLLLCTRTATHPRQQVVIISLYQTMANIRLPPNGPGVKREFRPVQVLRGR